MNAFVPDLSSGGDAWPVPWTATDAPARPSGRE